MPPTFTIVSQNRIPDPTDPTGQSDTWRIVYRTAAGTESWVTIPQQHYSAENVAKKVLEEYEQVAAIDGLQGEVM